MHENVTDQFRETHTQFHAATRMERAPSPLVCSVYNAISISEAVCILQRLFRLFRVECAVVFCVSTAKFGKQRRNHDAERSRALRWPRPDHADDAWRHATAAAGAHSDHDAIVRAWRCGGVASEMHGRGRGHDAIRCSTRSGHRVLQRTARVWGAQAASVPGFRPYEHGHGVQGLMRSRIHGTQCAETACQLRQQW